MFLAEQGAGCKANLDLLEMFGDPIGAMIGMVARIAILGAIGIFKAVGNIDSTNEGASETIIGETRWIVMYLACGSLIVACIKMALERKGEAGSTALKGILRVVVVAAASTTLINTFVTLMERYYQHVFNETLNALMSGVNCPGSNAIPDMLLLVIGCLLILSGIIHALLMWVRLGAMILLMGTLPLAAAASMTDWGSTWWRKHIGWMTAWLLYKPTVALIMYSGAIMVDKSEGYSNANTQIAGMATLLLSAVALPALMRLVVPATAALGGDSSGDATTAAAGGIASGAKSLSDAAGRSESDAPSGSRSPSGASGGDGSGGGGGRGSEGGRGPAGGADGGADGESEPGGGSAGSAGGGKAAGAKANPALAAVAVAAEMAGKAAKGAVNVAKSGIEGADGDRGGGGGRGGGH
ncbi:hypothetical protein [Streptomyces olivaceus]|uniref:hypothetical protein n=1 Tax=Streptomyces olivaceus TaxID=47716 RepID=UPI004055DF99